jgi:lysophospholipase L1-like esterase
MKLFYLLFSISLLGVTAAAQPNVKKFHFGGQHSGGFTVTRVDLYSIEKGFGFEPGAEVTCTDGETRHSVCSSAKPFYFSITLPEGNYRVSVTFGNETAAASTTVKAELRRLMIEKINTAAGRFATRDFIINVRTPQISTGGEVRLKDREKTSERWAWDEKLTLEFNGTRPSISELKIEKIDVPTVFLLGDSTVCDQPSEPYASWGQMITRFFNTRVAVANHAESGESLKSSLSAKRLDKVSSLMRPGDYLLVQYGHNDEKEKGDGVGAFTTYKAGLKHFIAEARKKGGLSVLITPMHRRTFGDDGKITNSHGDYPEAVRQVAREENVPLIDLTAMSKDLYEALGKEASGRLFKEGDGTHHNNYGAYQLAKAIVQSIRDQRLPLAKYVIKDRPSYVPKRPDAFESFTLPASPAVTNLKPLGN